MVAPLPWLEIMLFASGLFVFSCGWWIAVWMFFAQMRPK